MVSQDLMHLEDGRHRCQLCYEAFETYELEPVSNEPGRYWDVCQKCAEREKSQGALY